MVLSQLVEYDDLKLEAVMKGARRVVRFWLERVRENRIGEALVWLHLKLTERALGIEHDL